MACKWVPECVHLFEIYTTWWWWSWVKGALTVTFSCTLSQFKVQRELYAKKPDERESERRARAPVKKKKINEWPVVGLLLNQPTRQQARWPLGELAVRPSVSLLPIRPGTVKRSRGGLCRFVNLKNQETDKYLYHCQRVWHLSTLCKWHTLMLDEHRTTHKVQSSGAESHYPWLHISLLCRMV